MKPESEIGVALAPATRSISSASCRSRCRGKRSRTSAAPRRSSSRTSPSAIREAEGKPIVIANCQAGWQIMMTAAVRPDLAGRDHAGRHARSPIGLAFAARIRCAISAGSLGGTWLTALAGDMGAGIFDGAGLVANFESLNPANTYWTKPYNVYSKVDSETERFLEFETWWGSPVLLNAGEMQWIADNLVRRQQALDRRNSHLRRRARRPAQHQVADRLLLFLGRRHHPAAAGAGLGSRSLRRRERDRRQRTDDHLLAASQHRPPRHLRLG